MIIGSCGYGATGSSVLTDLLREFDDVQVYDDYEFTIAYRVDGLQDLEYHLMKQYAKNSSGDFAIKRFLEMSNCYKTPFIHKPCNGNEFSGLSQKFIKNIVQLEYRGVDTADMLTGNVLRNIFAFASKKVFLPKIVEKITHKPSFLWPCRKMYYSIEPENFYVEAQKYINSILEAMGADLSRPICLDQPFEGNNPENSMKFFEDPYAIIIDRDPRDLYLECKYTTHPDGKFFPRTNVNDFIVYYRNMRKNRSTSKNVMCINFESFIYEYDDSIKKIEQFLGVSKHLRPKTGFIPERSINNTQQIRNYPAEKNDIKLIEQELRDYLFPFEKYPKVQFSSQIFYGAQRQQK